MEHLYFLLPYHDCFITQETPDFQTQYCDFVVVQTWDIRLVTWFYIRGLSNFLLSFLLLLCFGCGTSPGVLRDLYRCCCSTTTEIYDLPAALRKLVWVCLDNERGSDRRSGLVKKFIPFNNGFCLLAFFRTLICDVLLRSNYYVHFISARALTEQCYIC